MFFHRNNDDDPRPTGGARPLPLLPLRDIIVFPHMVVPLFVGRERSINALEEAMSHDKEILLAAQRKAKTNDPAPEDIFPVGTIGKIIQLLRLPDGTVKVLVEGAERARIRRFLPNEDFFLCEVEEVVEPSIVGVELDALLRSVKNTFEAYVKLNKRIPPEMLVTIQTIGDPSRLADTLVVHLSSIKLDDRQGVLETLNPTKRLERLLELMNAEIEILQVEKKIRSRVKKQMEKSQKEYYLNEQMQAIQKELGEKDEFKSELEEIEERLAKKSLPREALSQVKKELKKLKMMQPMSAEAAVIRNYIDWVLCLPWSETSEPTQDLLEAQRILDEDHYGLKKPKERILEYLAVQTLVEKNQGPVLCLVGPPGVGKTSLAKSIARATGREFVRLSLGGVRDEAEIRGHRRTYIGALPGRLIQSLKRCGTNNPVFLLDEVDKMSSDFRGDPAAALLEVLDPEQNASFSDHYLDLDYDLSDVMFITTANTLNGIPIPLQDRLEIIELSSYTDFEKLNIAMRYLIPRQLEAAGLTPSEASRAADAASAALLDDDSPRATDAPIAQTTTAAMTTPEQPIEFTEAAVRAIIHHYTRESGVRSLERQIGGICRKIARKVVEQRSLVQQGEANADKHGPASGLEAGMPRTIEREDVPVYLGVPKFLPEKLHDRDEVGLTNGLAYTSYGGTLLECEVAIVPGKGKLVITGLLEKGMQESAQAAMSYIRSRQRVLGLDEDFYHKIDCHVHFPEFVPKDGPSAGVTMATSIASALLKIPVRRNVAMTGEITLRGRVMPIGGLKEKLLAAHRAGIDTVLVPAENRKDLRDVPTRVLSELRIVLVEHTDQVLREALSVSDPDALFGDSREAPLEYRDGKLYTPTRAASEDEDVPEPTVDAPGARQ